MSVSDPRPNVKQVPLLENPRRDVVALGRQFRAIAPEHT